MKKFGTILVFVVFAILIVGFNYLVWDRDSKTKEIDRLRDLTAGKNVSISERLDEIRGLEQELDAAKIVTNRLQTENGNLNDELNASRSERAAINKVLSNRNDLINILKPYADIKIFREPVNEWISAMNSGEYEKAYDMQFANYEGDKGQLDREEYIKDLKAGIESVSLTSITVDNDKGVEDGYLYLVGDVEIAVASEPALSSAGYKAGTNKLSFRIDFDSRTEKFIIGEIGPYTE